MQVLRVSPVPIVLAFVAGVALMGVSSGPSADEMGPVLWDVGYALVVLSVATFAAVLWCGVYLEVREAARGMPGLRSVGQPEMKPEVAANLREKEQSLSALGFRHDGWFSLDDFAVTHVSAWRHETHSTAAFILYFPVGGNFRLRFVRRFPSGGVLASTTRLTDLSYPPPEGMYLQMRKHASVDELLAWHREAESLFPGASSVPDDTPAGSPRDLFVAIGVRWANHWMRDRTWLLGVEPVGECWRMYHLCGMPLARQFELGWATPFWR
jgi:hypothetical protein